MKGRHQGKLVHPGMTSIVKGHGAKKDHLAHSSHHEMNAAHYTPHGLSPEGQYDDGDEPCNDGHGGMGENYSHE